MLVYVPLMYVSVIQSCCGGKYVVQGRILIYLHELLTKIAIFVPLEISVISEVYYELNYLFLISLFKTH